MVVYKEKTEETESIHKPPKFKIGDRARITKRNKTNPWEYEIKYLNRETIIGWFYEKELLSRL